MTASPLSVIWFSLELHDFTQGPYIVTFPSKAKAQAARFELYRLRTRWRKNDLTTFDQYTIQVRDNTLVFTIEPDWEFTLPSPPKGNP